MTLSEVMISSLISVMVLATLINMMISFRSRYEEGRVLADIDSNLRASLQRITRDIRVSDGIENSYSSYSSGANAIVLKMNSLDSSNDILDYGNKYDYIIYRINPSDSSSLQMIIAANASSSRTSGTTEITDMLNSFSLTYNNVDYALSTNVNIAMTVNDSVLGNTKTNTMSTFVELRNK